MIDRSQTSLSSRSVCNHLPATQANSASDSQRNGKWVPAKVWTWQTLQMRG